MKPRTILFLTASPRNFTPLNLQYEVKAIREGLRQSTYRDNYLLVESYATRIQDMRKAVLQHQPHIVHFSGHGEGGLGLVFEDEDGQAKLVPEEALSEFFGLFSSHIECVVLNACYSQVQAQAIARHIGYTVGMEETIENRAATQFSVAFYDSLGEGKDYEAAFYIARNELHLRGLSGGQEPVLIPLSDSRSGKESKAEQIEYPDGAVDSDSPFYVHPRLENEAIRAIELQGALLKIKAPKGMGKTSLRDFVLNSAQKQNYRTVALDFRGINASYFNDIEQFYRWFCKSVAEELGLHVDVEELWNSRWGPNDNCTSLFEKYFLLDKDNRPLVLALDNFERLFKHHTIEVDFCAMLRSWFEKRNIDKKTIDKKTIDSPWKQLRQIVVYSQESFQPLDLNQSPFNVGVFVELGPWTADQIRELSQIHGVNLSSLEIEQLLDWTGGHPHLVRLTLYSLAVNRVDLVGLLEEASTEAGIFSKHLIERLSFLEKEPELITVMQTILNSDGPVKTKSQIAFKLVSMGLVKRRNNDVAILCRAYREYFKEQLSS